MLLQRATFETRKNPFYTQDLVGSAKTGEKGKNEEGELGSPKDQTTQTGKDTCHEHMWTTAKLDKTHLSICVAYMAISPERQTSNEEICNCIKKDIEQTYKNKLILLIGNFNCHITLLEGYEKNAVEFRRLVKQCNLHIANLDSTCRGTYTWSRRSNESAIDYVLYNDEASQNIHITSMQIDEEKYNNCESDHNRKQ